MYSFLCCTRLMSWVDSTQSHIHTPTALYHTRLHTHINAISHTSILYHTHKTISHIILPFNSNSHTSTQYHTISHSSKQYHTHHNSITNIITPSHNINTPTLFFKSQPAVYYTHTRNHTSKLHHTYTHIVSHNIKQPHQSEAHSTKC